MTACDNSQTPNRNRPGKVIWVEKTTDMAAEERGIDAVPEEDGIFLQWYKLSDRDIRYYNVYRKNVNEGFFSKIRQIDAGATAGRDTTFIDSDPVLNITNEYYIAAENSDGLQGVASDTIAYKLLDKAETSSPNSDIQGLPIFFWSLAYVSVQPDSFILRIEQDFPPYDLHFARKFQSDYQYDPQVLNLSDVPDRPDFEIDRWYKWRIDLIGTNILSSGSESQYLRFRIN